jgi:hypothetical protein
MNDLVVTMKTEFDFNKLLQPTAKKLKPLYQVKIRV